MSDSRHRKISKKSTFEKNSQREKFDWKATIKINILKLKVVGLWPRGDESYKLNLYTVWAAISFTFFIFAHNFFQAINIIFHLDDLKAVTSIIFLNLSELLGIIKAYFLYQNMPILKQLMVTLNSDIFQPKSKRQRRLIEPNLNFWKLNYRIFWSMSIGAIICWTTIPFFTNSVKDHQLPFMAWYPYDITVSPNYEITYIYQVIGVFFIAFSTIGVDTLITALTMYTGAQLDILCDDLRHMKASDFNNKLIMCIKHHKEILRFTENSNAFFNWIVFLQFFISATSIAITMFQITVVEPFSGEFFSLLAFELAIIVEIFMYCWFGNGVEEKSKKIVYSAFQSDWINASKEAKKNLIFFTLNCQKPIVVSALHLFNLTLETFVKIMRTSWSYFALLQQMGGRK